MFMIYFFYKNCLVIQYVLGTFHDMSMIVDYEKLLWTVSLKELQISLQTGAFLNWDNFGHSWVTQAGQACTEYALNELELRSWKAYKTKFELSNFF